MCKPKTVENKKKPAPSVQSLVIDFLQNKISTVELYSKLLDLRIPKGTAVRYVNNARFFFDLPHADLGNQIVEKANLNDPESIWNAILGLQEILTAMEKKN